MFFKECERLAEKHPNLADVVLKVDTQLKKMGSAQVMRVDDFASFLGVDPNQVASVFEMLEQEGLLLAEEMVECPHCDMPVLRSDYEAAFDEEGEYCCTDCERPLNLATARKITTYRQGEKWKDMPPPEPGQEKTPAKIETLDSNAWYTHDQLSKIFCVGKDALRKRLERYRKTDMGDGWKEKTDRRPREPRYIYQLKAVRDIIEELQASSERPAK